MAVGGNDVAVVKVMTFPRAFSAGWFENAARDNESFRAADSDNANSGHAERRCGGCYGILAKHSRALPLIMIYGLKF